MGRHSSTSPWGFYRSVIAYFLPWIMVAAVAIVGLWLAIGALGGDEVRTSGRTPGEDRRPAATESEEPETEEPTPATDADREEPTTEPTRKPRRREPLITEGITVQVLNGTADEEADDAMADRLAGLGYEVVSIQPASVDYSTTTVMWSFEESQEAAEALAQRFGWDVRVKPPNLSASVSMHVIVGADQL